MREELVYLRQNIQVEPLVFGQYMNCPPSTMNFWPVT
jgi:hypothetical protein